jgi:hypothetical protein
MFAKLQSWLPFPITIYLNGREWLSRMLDKKDERYAKVGNCFAAISDFKRAQKLFDAQHNIDWVPALDRIAKVVNPLYRTTFSREGIPYYWAIQESEFATVLLFKSPSEAGEFFDRCTRYGIHVLRCADVLRFLGHRLNKNGEVNGNLTRKVLSSLAKRYDGLRIKHTFDKNTVKAYNKLPNLIRIECTIVNNRLFKGFRSGSQKMLRKTVADAYLRAKASKSVNDRYSNALASIDDSPKAAPTFESVCKPVTWENHRFRALNIFSPSDRALLALIADGRFTLNGFKNRDIRQALFPPSQTPQEAKRLAAKVTRTLRLLRAHGLIRKVPSSHAYHLTDSGRKLTALLGLLGNATSRDLLKLAA